MWRILNPPYTTDMTKMDEAVANGTSNRVRSLCDNLDADFKKSPARFLLRPLESEDARKERAKTLRDIFMSAARIATSLWTQRSYLLCLDLEGFKSRKMSFNIASPLMQGHPLSKVDPDNPRHNGRKILVVVRPALLAFEVDDKAGLDGNAFRVLAKAIVWLED